jgi:hypothetical protein
VASDSRSAAGHGCERQGFDGRDGVLPLEHERHLFDRQWGEAHARAAGPDGIQQGVRASRHQHEHRARRGLFEGLEQRVLRERHQRVGLVDHDDPPLRFERPVAEALGQRANVLHADVARVLVRLEQDDVRMHQAQDAAARRTLPARVHRQDRLATFVEQPFGATVRTAACRRAEVLTHRLHRHVVQRYRAVERLREGERGTPLPDPRRPGEDQTRRKGAQRDRAGQERQGAVMAGNLAKRHGVVVGETGS